MRPNRVLVIAALVAACVLISLPAVSQKAQTQPVLVVNGSGQPVPTAAQGVTNVAGTVNLSSGSTVNVGNTPSVNVANTPTVSLTSGASVSVTNPLDAQNNPTPLAVLEAIQPYEDTCVLSFGGIDSGLCFFQIIPAGKRLVVQEFDAYGFVETGLKPIQIFMQTSYEGLAHYFTTTFMGNAQSLDNFATHQETRLYVDPRLRQPTCVVGLSGISSTGRYTCVFSGYLVDAP